MKMENRIISLGVAFSRSSNITLVYRILFKLWWRTQFGSWLMRDKGVEVTGVEAASHEVLH